MNIVFVSDAIYPYSKGGKEKRLYELSTRLAAMGHDVHIYTMHWWNSPERTRVEDGVKLHAISKLHAMYSGERRSIKEGVFFGLACLKLFAVKFDVLDVDHMPFFPIYSAWLVCLLRREKFYGTWHESLTRESWISYMGWAGIVAAAIEHVSIKLPTRIIAASDRTGRLLATDHQRLNNIDVVSSGIDSKLLNKLAPAAIQCDVLYCGRFVKDKNIDMLIRAIAIIAAENPNVRCILVGHGIEKAHLAELIKKLKLTSQISLVDPLPNASDVYSYMKAAKVFCLPSSREGFGIVVLESLGCGTPVVTVDSAANTARDLIRDGKNGSVVPLEPRAIATALQYWIFRPKPEQLASEVAVYDWDDLALKQARIYAS